MASLKGPVVCPVVRAKQTGVYSVPVDSPLLKAEFIRSKLWVLKGLRSGRTNAGYQQQMRKCSTIRCSFSSSSNGNGSMAGNSNEKDSDYVNSSVVEAVETPSVLLMAALRNIQTARPTTYEVVKDMIEKMGYRAKRVRITKRVHEAYFAQLHLAKLDNEAEIISFDLLPSDAINIAVRCQVPIQVNKFLAYSDGMKVIESAKVSVQSSSSVGLILTELDRPTGQPCIETKEFILVRNMLIAAVEERYRDAALWRDKLTLLRSKRNWT